jgi:hypothetical protein
MVRDAGYRHLADQRVPGHEDAMGGLDGGLQPRMTAGADMGIPPADIRC